MTDGNHIILSSEDRYYTPPALEIMIIMSAAVYAGSNGQSLDSDISIPGFGDNNW